MSGTVSATQQPGGGSHGSSQTITSTIRVSGDYAGSIPSGLDAALHGPLLTITEAIRRGLECNLGSKSARAAEEQAHAGLAATRSTLLPTISASLSENVNKINLAAQGFNASAFPSIGSYFPSTVGPFHYYSAQANLSENLFDAVAIKNLATSKQQSRAAALGTADAREQVVLAVAGSYLRLLSDVALVRSEAAQVKYSQAVYDQAVAQEEAGAKAHVEVNRNLVQLQTEKQRLAVDEAAFSKDKMVLARQIGLSIDAPFEVAEALTGDLQPELTLPTAYERAFHARSDLRAAEVQVQAAQSARGAAGAERLPALKVQGFYGLQGVDLNRGASVYNGSLTLSLPIFNGGQIRSDEKQADIALQQRKNELNDLREQIRFDVRSAWIDRDVAANEVRVADSNRLLAAETLKQSTDRFFAGAATAVEVVQSEQAVAGAERDYISALFALNLAKISLARAMGEAEQDIPVVLKGAQ